MPTSTKCIRERERERKEGWKEAKLDAYRGNQLHLLDLDKLLVRLEMVSGRMAMEKMRGRKFSWTTGINRNRIRMRKRMTTITATKVRIARLFESEPKFETQYRVNLMSMRGNYSFCGPNFNLTSSYIRFPYSYSVLDVSKQRHQVAYLSTI